MITVVSAKGHIDCRVATETITECNPYSPKLLFAKEIKYQKNKKKLIVEKTLPVPKKKSVKVISVVDMIEKYVKIEKPIRYKGSENKYLEKLHIESPKDNNKHSLSRELELRREATIAKLLQMEKEAYSKSVKLEVCIPPEKGKKEEHEEEIKEVKEEGIYTIANGDNLSTIAKKFGVKISELREMNKLQKGEPLSTGKKLMIPLRQEMINIIATAEYVIEPGDNIGSIAQEFNLSSSDIMKYNQLNRKSIICIGKKLILPFPYKIAELEKKRQLRLAKEKAEAKKSRMIRGFGKRKLRVTATAYSSHRGQTDKTPFLAAWNNRIRPGMKIIAVSRDMLTKYGLRNGSKVRIGGLSGLYTVRDKMNKRYRKRIDIYMGTNRRRALQWGRRSVVIYY